MSVFTLICMMLLGLGGCSGNSKEDPFLDPEATDIINALMTIGDITEIAAVSEDNDPNRLLGKQGGYKAALVFGLKQTGISNLSSSELIEKGITAGGTIEIYSTESEARQRVDYLSAFDGSSLMKGTHTVKGSLVIRLSKELNTADQKALEEAIIESIENTETTTGEESGFVSN